MCFRRLSYQTIIDVSNRLYRNACQKPSRESVTISNETDLHKFNPTRDYYIRDTYRTRNLNVRSEIRRIGVDGKEQERRYWIRVDDTRRARLTRSESLQDVDVRRERVRDARERGVVVFRDMADRRALERNDRRLLGNRFAERTLRREVRDGGYERQTTRVANVDARKTATYIRQVGIVYIWARFNKLPVNN